MVAFFKDLIQRILGRDPESLAVLIIHERDRGTAEMASVVRSPKRILPIV